MKKRRSIFLAYKGKPGFPRYVITESGGKSWAGRRWATRRQRPLLFADINEAAKTAQLLLEADYQEATCVECFVVPICLKVRSRAGVSPDDLKRWLRKAVSVTVAVGNLGNGPTDDSLVLVHVDWARFERIDDEKRT